MTAKELEPVYLLEGEADTLAAGAERDLRRACFPAGGEETGCARWDGDRLAEALAFLQTIPFSGGKRMAIVTLASSGEGDGDRPDIAVLEHYLDDPPPWAVLVIRVRGRAGGRLRSLCAKHGTVIACRVGRGDFPSWVRERARARGVNLGPARAWLLGEMCGGDPDLVETELEKLSLALEPGRPVREEDLREHVFPGPAAPFALADAWANRDLPRALDCLSRLLEQGADAPRLLGTLAWQVRSLLLYSYLQREGMRSPAEAAKLMETSSAGVRATAARARKFTVAELESALEMLGETDYLMKTGRVSPRQALEEFLFRTASGSSP
ncbi:MAG: DNA polymerase III subunit delta [Bacillota bacterium]|nr:DNA polymerase III subunit delta [Bacillota bacterium]